MEQGHIYKIQGREPTAQSLMLYKMFQVPVLNTEGNSWIQNSVTNTFFEIKFWNLEWLIYHNIRTFETLSKNIGDLFSENLQYLFTVKHFEAQFVIFEKSFSCPGKVWRCCAAVLVPIVHITFTVFEKRREGHHKWKNIRFMISFQSFKPIVAAPSGLLPHDFWG